MLRDPGVHVDLLLTDVVMPGMTIDAFAAQARASRPGLRVLLMSGYDQPAALADGGSGSGTQVLAKPFSRAALNGGNVHFAASTFTVSVSFGWAGSEMS